MINNTKTYSMMRDFKFTELLFTGPPINLH